MTVVWAWLRSEAKARWRAWLALAGLVGLFSGVVLGAVAGARRTETAYPRFLSASAAADVYISPFQQLLRGSYEEIRSLPQVADAGMMGVPRMAEVGPAGASNLLIFCMASADGQYGYTIHRPKILAGRLPQLDEPGEALIDPATARKLGVRMGQQVRLYSFSKGVADPDNIDPSEGTLSIFTIVGIGVFPDQVVSTQPLEDFPRLFLSPAAYRLYGPPDAMVYEEIFVRLKPGADLDAFRAEVDRITAADPDAGGHDLSTSGDHTPKVQRAIRPQATALALFAFFAALAGLLIVGQTLTRHIRFEATDYPTLRALGVTRRQLAAMSMFRTVGIAVLGGLLGTGLAIALSPLMPIGPARVAEPDPGPSADLAVLGGGVVLLVLLLVLVTAWPTWRAATAAESVPGTAPGPGADRPSRLVSALTRRGAPVTAVAGVRLAVEPGRGPSAVPVRNTVGATTLALLSLLAALTFGANLNRLITDPHRYGKTWDGLLEGGYTNLPRAMIVDRLRTDPDVERFSGGTPGEVVIGGRQVPAVGIDPIQGLVFPTLLEGRPPDGPDEIVLGTKVLRRLRGSLGDTVDVNVGGETRPMRVVGRAVFPPLGVPGHGYTGLGEGAAVTAACCPRCRRPTRTRRTSTTSS